MRLDRLLAETSLEALGIPVELSGDPAVEVTTVTMDSSRVTPGSLFACVPGKVNDGHLFAPAAVAHGATALLCERRLDLAVTQVVVPSVRTALGPVCHVAFGRPSEHLRIAAVTGTNGKTTTCAFLRAIFEVNGWPATAVGTLSQARTTPEAPDLHALLAGWRADGGVAVAMEVSSHALEQHRTDAVRFEAGVFTNLSPEHLDYHGDMERYFESKARLFAPGRVGVAVIGVDDEWGSRMAARVADQGGRLLTWTAGDANDVQMTPAGSKFSWRGYQVDIRVGGGFNVANAVAAATCAEAMGVPVSVIVDGLGAVGSVAGRFQMVEAGQDFAVIVDYAHTPDGLAKVLAAARQICSGRLIVVFGAGGDRDREKRPLMGEAAARLADLVLVTSDNPRSEDPGAIIAEVLEGTDGRDQVRAVEDRAVAISTALATAGPGDVVVIAGKGHEKGQEIAGRVLPFDDVEVARAAIDRILISRGGAAR
jgi:UDP-N-acetylmuramoyl-L-alanyl-D-glutamate--2,6-diaminopimelate ligase